MDREKLQQMVKKAFDQPEKSERFLFLENAHIKHDSNDTILKHNPNECESCAYYSNLFVEEVKKQLNQYDNNNN